MNRIWLCSMLSVFLAGCAGQGTPTQVPGFTITSPVLPPPTLTPARMLAPSLTYSPTVTRTATATATHIPIPTTALPSATMGPTLTYDERYNFFVDMLDTNGGCQLPCFWGFNPGETRWEEVRSLILHLGLSIYEGRRGDIFSFEFQNPQVSFLWSISMYVTNGIVDIFSSEVVIHDESPLMVQYKEPFSLRSILLTHGVPDRIWMGLGVGGEVSDPIETMNEIFLFYDQRGMLIKYFGGANKVNDTYQSCPNTYDEQTHRIIWSSVDLQSLQSDRPLEDINALWSLSGVPLEPVTYPIEEATGLSVEEFYTLITQEGEAACFSTPRNIWP